MLEQKNPHYEACEKEIMDRNQMILEAEERGEQRGKERMSRLFSFLVQDKRFEELERVAEDDDFLQQLMLEYGI